MEVLAAYFIIGFIFGIFFIFFGVARLDPDARGSDFKFRLMILPGTILLWPYLAYKLIAKN